MKFEREAWSEALKGLVKRHFDAFVADVSPSLPEVRWHTEWLPGIYVPFAGGLLFDHDRGEAFRQSVMVGVSANDRGDRLEIFVDICLGDGTVVAAANDVDVPIAGSEQELIEAVAEAVDRGLTTLREQDALIVDYMIRGTLPEEAG